MISPSKGKLARSLVLLLSVLVILSLGMIACSDDSGTARPASLQSIYDKVEAAEKIAAVMAGQQSNQTAANNAIRTDLAEIKRRLAAIEARLE